MAENTHPSHEAPAEAVSIDRESGTVPRLVESLEAHPRFQALGLAKDSGEISCRSSAPSGATCPCSTSTSCEACCPRTSTCS